jgi:hypothetical protein
MEWFDGDLEAFLESVVGGQADAEDLRARTSL